MAYFTMYTLYCQVIVKSCSHDKAALNCKFSLLKSESREYIGLQLLILALLYVDVGARNNNLLISIMQQNQTTKQIVSAYQSTVKKQTVQTTSQSLVRVVILSPFVPRIIPLLKKICLCVVRFRGSDPPNVQAITIVLVDVFASIQTIVAA